jgi:hypothetical protein
MYFLIIPAISPLWFAWLLYVLSSFEIINQIQYSSWCFLLPIFLIARIELSYKSSANQIGQWKLYDDISGKNSSFWFNWMVSRSTCSKLSLFIFPNGTTLTSWWHFCSAGLITGDFRCLASHSQCFFDKSSTHVSLLIMSYLILWWENRNSYIGASLLVSLTFPPVKQSSHCQNITLFIFGNIIWRTRITFYIKLILNSNSMQK